MNICRSEQSELRTEVTCQFTGKTEGVTYDKRTEVYQ